MQTASNKDEDSRATEANAAPAEPKSMIRFRSILLGLFILPINAFWVVQMEWERYSAHPTTISLFFNAVFILLVLSGLNKLVVKIRPSWALRQAELLLIYSMVCIGSCMCGHDFGQVLVPSLCWPYCGPDLAHNYSRFVHFLPKWALVSDKAAVSGFFLGHDTIYTPRHIMAWLPAALIWSSFVVVLLWVMQCVNVLIRKQWTDNERLSYPLTRMPLDITATQPFGKQSSTGNLMLNKLFWIGFCLAAGVDTTNSLNYYIPSIPAILTPGHGQSFIDLSTYVPSKPWSAIGWTPLSFYPFVIGLGMLLPMDFLFSAWFFYIMWKVQSVVTVANGWDADSRMPYANYQAFGAYAAFFISTIWLSRKYLAQVFRKGIGLSSELDDSDEPLRYRTALSGIAGGMVLLVGFSVALGMSWYIAVAFFIIYLALALAITRMRAEMGTPVHDLHFTGPDWTMGDLVGPQALGSGNLAVFSMFFWFNRAYRCQSMPFQLEGLKMAEQSGARKEMQKWVWAMLAAGGFGMLCSFWAVLHLGYAYGNPLFGPEAWDRYSSWLSVPKPPNHMALGALAVGLLFAGFLQAMRTTGIWWPFHPLAYAVSGSWEMNLLWMPLLIAWAVKGLLLRYGGLKTYNTALPFFYGLILGQFVPGSLLNIWGIATHTPTYQFWQ